MDEKQIEEVKQILTDWNPLGTRANQGSPDKTGGENEIQLI